MARPTSLSAVTLLTADMAAAVGFYTALGFEVRYGGPGEPFTSFQVAPQQHLNLQATDTPPQTRWGRHIWYVDDVDAVHARAVAAGLSPEGEPADAPWGERYVHIRDPDGHEISLAHPL